MIRRAMVVLLVLASVGSVVLLSRSAGPRGVTFSLYDAPGWSGEPSKTWQARHLDHGSSLRRQKFGLPDGSSLRASGWIYIPRRGTYQFEVESDDDNWLYIDDQLVSSNPGKRKPKVRSRHIERGFHKFRLDTNHRKGGHKTLVRWRLPAGYMDLESIPPFFLRPEQPSSAPLPWTQRALPLALLFAALLVAFGPALGRRIGRLRSDGRYRVEVVAGLAVFSLALGVRVVDLNGAGETCDEWAYAMAGQIYVSNAAHGYFQSTYWNSNDEHPPIGKYIYGLASHLAGTDDFGPMRMAAALMNALTVWLTFLIGLRLFSLPAAITAAITLALMPHFIAHGKVSGLDAPSALLYTAAIALFLRAARRPSHDNWGYVLASLVACLAFATKFSNATVFIFMVAVYIYREWPQLRERGTMDLPVSLYLLPAMPVLVLFVSWPWLWREPFGQLVKTLSHWNYPISEWFLGQFQTPPLYYYLVYLLATTPAALLVPIAMFFTRPRTEPSDAPPETGDHSDRLRAPSAGRIVVFFWLMASLLWSFSSFKQDGIRYIYTALPALALMVGAGMERLIFRVQWWPAAWVALAGYLGWQVSTVHPYQLDYYNELVGGPETVWKNQLLEVGWWGEGIPRAVEHVNRVAHNGATWGERGIITHTFYGLRPDLRRDDNPDFLIASNLQPSERAVEGYEVDFEVLVDGAPVVVVYIKFSTLKRHRLGLDPGEDTEVPFSELGRKAKQRAEDAKRQAREATDAPNPADDDSTPAESDAKAESP